MPRIDSSPVFGELIGGPSAGYFSVSPSDGAVPTSQGYVGNGLVLETTFPSMTVTDYLDVSNERYSRIAGRTDLLRTITGRGPITIEFAPRVDFGRVPTRLEVRDGGIIVQGTADQLALRSPGVVWTISTDGQHETAHGTAELVDGQPLVLELRSGTATLRDDPATESARRNQSADHWASWVGALDLDGVDPSAHEFVVASALAIKGLTHGPTGAIAAAATTSLPSHVGGVRNFDERYCWLRTAAQSAEVLVRLGSSSEALSYLGWLEGVLETRADPERLAPLYNVTGRHLPPEAEIARMAGYGGSRPCASAMLPTAKFSLTFLARSSA
ncbi:MAG: trehalase-like domain-containing protein [Acidimicrobiales bacterium]